MLITPKWFILAGIPVWILFRFIFARLKDKKVSFEKESKYFLAYLYLLFLISITLFPIAVNMKITHNYENDNYNAFHNIIGFLKIGLYKTFLDVGGNILLFMPMGFFLHWFLKEHVNVFKALIICFLISTCIELIQYTGIPYMRQTDVDDVLLNTFGGLAGYLSYKIFIYF